MPATSRRRRLAVPALAGILALAPAGCDLGGPDADAPQLVQQWVLAEEEPPAVGTPAAVEVEGGSRIVRLEGDFVRTCTSGNAGITYAREGQTLTFRATFRPAERCANSAPTRQYMRYIAYIVQMPIGTYQVRVIHENDERAGESGTVLEETVTVF